MDVLQAWQAGFRNLVAQMGTALTPQQLNLLKRYTKRYVLALDADAAGQKATMRGLQVARETLDRESISSFDARGLVQHEGRLKADIRIVTIPDGKDPDNIIAEDPAAWTALLETARPVVRYVIDMATADLDMDDAKAKTAVAQQVIPLIKDIGEPVERDHYWQALADALQVDERALRRVEIPQKKRPFQQQPSPPRSTGQRPVVQAKQSKKAAQKTKPSPPGGNPPPPDAPPDWYMQDNSSYAGSVPPPPDGDWLEGSALSSAQQRQTQTAVLGNGSLLPAMREENYLRECFRHLAIMRQVDQKLNVVDQTAVNANDFALAEDREIFNHLRQYTVATTEQLCDSLSEPLRNRALTLLRSSDEREIDLNRLAETLTLSVCDWRLAKVKQHIREIRFIHSDTSQETDSKNNLHLYQDELNRLTTTMLNLHQAKNRMSAASRRQAE
jgi:DNA primase